MVALEQKELEKLVEKYQKKADEAEQAYQETGMTRYCSTYWRNQDLADALRMAMSAKEDHDALREMRLMLSNFASRGAAAVSPTGDQTSGQSWRHGWQRRLLTTADGTA